MTRSMMSEEEKQERVLDLLRDAVTTFPPELQDAAAEWLAKATACIQLITEIEEKGLSALL